MTDRVPAWMLAVVAMSSVQLGAALSTFLFDDVGPAGSAWLRLVVGAAIVLLLIRPPWRTFVWRDVRLPVVLGVVTAVMAICFLQAVDRLPLGTAVAIEFLGPLGVAVVRSRTPGGLIWPVLALSGVLLLTEPWQGEVDVVGVAFAAAAAGCWATYIVLTQHIGDRFAGLQGLAITIPVAALAATVVGLPQAWGGITPVVMVQAVGLALLLPVIPFALELLALRRLTTAAFGTLMALEPAVATGFGVLLLGQIPVLTQVVGVALVVVAGVGAERIGHR